MTVSRRLPFRKMGNTDNYLQGIITACVQFFFAWRILVITRSKSVTVLVAFGTFVNLRR